MKAIRRQSLRDDRGREVRLMESSQIPAWMSATARRRLQAAVRTDARQQTRRLALAGIALFGSLIVATAVLGRRIDMGMLSAMWLAFAVVAAPALIAARHLGRRHADRALRACRHARVCAACGYDVRQCPAQQDGCTVCPECGAAWAVKSTG